MAKAAQYKAVAGLDALEQKFFKTQMQRNKGDVDRSLHVLVNMVEGDCSQLSPPLARYATSKHWVRCR